MNPRASASSRRRNVLAGILTALAFLVWAAPASAEFGLSQFDVQYSAEDATPGIPSDDPAETQAGAHPFAMTTSFELNYVETNPGEYLPDERIKDLIIEQIPGLSGDATTIPECPTQDFLAPDGNGNTMCENSTVVGIAAISLFFPPPMMYVNVPIVNMPPPPGVAVRIGFKVANVPQIVDITVKPGGDYNIIATSDRISQVLAAFGGAIQLWGVPADSAHDPLRGTCISDSPNQFVFGEINFTASATGESCPAGVEPTPLLNLPGSCTGPAETKYKANPWVDPNRWVEGSTLTHDSASPPNPQGFTGCGKLDFEPAMEAKPSADSAETGTGLSVDVSFDDEGLKNPDGLVESQAKKVEVALPKGVTVNPSIGEGLGFCTPADLERETLSSKPGDGCPNASKIGSLDLESPLVDEQIAGDVFLAQQDDPATTTAGAENPFDSLIALYLVLRNTTLGINVKLPMKVEPDPRTGQLVATVDGIPQLPFSSFSFRLREGQRAALVTPPVCGRHTTVAKFYPWSDPGSPRTISSSFEIVEGIGGSPCPSGGVPSFAPDFEAGSLNNNAKSFSPFTMRLTRRDGEQDMTKFGAILPRGVLGKIAGVAKCPGEAVATARSKSGRDELASPSCPSNSEIGRTLAGAGVGSALTYVPGRIYLSGPYKGAPLSVIAITPAVAGPFDAGTVAVQIGLTLNAETAEVEVLGDSSDPIPHILKGIPLKLRDLRIAIDRDSFTLNPTSCDESSARGSLFGAGVDLFGSADDAPAQLATRYQAANCLNLPFKPQLQINLTGGSKRGDHPALRAVLNARPQDANIGAATVTLPRSAFLEQSHIRTICTRCAVRRRQLPRGVDLRPREGLDPAARRNDRRAGLPALLQPQAA